MLNLLESRRAAGEDVHYVFMDTGAEHPGTYAFIRNIINVWQAPITLLRLVVNPERGKANTYRVITQDELIPDLGPWRLMMMKYGTPYAPGGAFCTDRMKNVPFTKYCQAMFGKGNYQTWLGIRFDEPGRLWGGRSTQYLRSVDTTRDERR